MSVFIPSATSIIISWLGELVLHIGYFPPILAVVFTLIPSVFIGLVVVYTLMIIKQYLHPGYHPQEPMRLSFQWPLVGSAIKILGNINRIYEFNREMHEKYGWIYCWQLFHIFGVSTCNPEHIKRILNTNFKNYEKGPLMQNTFKPFLGNGIFAVNGCEWKQQRTLAKPFFKVPLIKNMFPIFNKHASIVTRILSKSSNTRKPIDIQKLFMQYTMDTICELGFGFSLGSLEKPVEFQGLFDYVQAQIDRRGYNPYHKYNPIQTIKFYWSIRKIDAFVYDIISKRRQEDLTDKTDLLSRFVNECDDLSNKYLRDIILNLFLAGKDTTGNLLTWTFCELVKNPDVLKKLVAEINEICINDYVTWEQIRKMPYLKAILKETLRLHPSVPANFKFAVENDYLPNKDGPDYLIKAGTYVQINSFTLHTLKTLWGPDAYDFDPDRWIDDRRKNIHPYQYIPFHAGARRCLGEKLALPEASVLICKILQQFKFEMTQKQKEKGVRYSKSLTLPVDGGLYVNVNKYE